MLTALIVTYLVFGLREAFELHQFDSNAPFLTYILVVLFMPVLRLFKLLFVR